MQINITDPVQQTAVFIVLFLGLVFCTLKKSHPLQLALQQTNELKGVAILMVLFGHIGYFLASDNRFLWPLSVNSGVGVNIFLFLSGYGLTASLVKHKTTLLRFYKKRFLNIYPAMWIVIGIFIWLDFFVLRRIYTFESIIQNFLGFFPNADLAKDLNSPLWYFTFIASYYLLLPLIFVRKYPGLTGIALILIGYLVTRLALPVNKDVLKLYQTHYLAFPLGILFYQAVTLLPLNKVKIGFSKYFRYLLLLIFLLIAGYLSIHSNVGQGIYKEQLTSLCIVLSVVVAVVMKDHESRFLTFIGMYSYEIYLIHWPLISRYELIYKYLPPSLATLLYIGVLVSLGWLSKELTRSIHQLLSGHPEVR